MENNQRALTVKDCYDGLKWHMNNDDEYCWGWHWNLAMCVLDSTNVNSYKANESALYMMRYFYNIDMTKNQYYIDWLERYNKVNDNGH